MSRDSDHSAATLPASLESPIKCFYAVIRLRLASQTAVLL